MADATDFYGRPYDDAVPVFIPCFSGAMVFDRLAHKLIDTASLQAAAAARNPAYTISAKEMGPAPAWYNLTHDFPGEDASSAPTPAPSATAITVAADATAKTVTVGGGPLAAGDADQITVTVAAGTETKTNTFTVGLADTATATAAAIAAATWTPFTASASGKVVTFAKGTAVLAISSVTASIV